MKIINRKRLTSAVLLTLGTLTFSPAWTTDVVSQAQIIAGGNDEKLGKAIAISPDGELMVVGIPDYENSSGTRIGAARLYKKANNGDWQTFADLTGKANADFGTAVAISEVGSGYLVLVGAYGDDLTSYSNEGAAYIYTGTLSTSEADWNSSKTEIRAPNADNSDQFGYAVAAYGETIAIGANGEKSNENSNATNPVYTPPTSSATDNDDFNGSGAVYIFEKDNSGAWQATAYLKASDNVQVGTGWNAKKYDGEFGKALSMTATHLLVGAPEAEPADTTHYTGGLYVFNKDSNASLGWRFNQKLTVSKAADAGNSGRLGASVALSAGYAVTGLSTNRYGGSEKYAYLFDIANNFSASAIKGNETESGDKFGRSVAIDGDTVLIGAPEEDSTDTQINGNEANNATGYGNGDIGAAYLFTRDNGTWTQTTYLKGSTTDAEDHFGTAVALHGRTVAVGSPNKGDSSNRPGELYIFDKAGQYALGGTITGLADGTITLTNTDDTPATVETLPLAIGDLNNNAYAFSNPVTDGDYSISISDQPNGQTCEFTTNNTTSLAISVSGAAVNNINVGCTNNTYRLGGTLSGLASGGEISIRENTSGQILTLGASDTSFTFANPLAHGSNYQITLTASNSGAQFCQIQPASGTVNAADVSNVAITCADVNVTQYPVGGIISVPAGETFDVLKLSFNGNEQTINSLATNGGFSLADTFPAGTYGVLITQQPSGLICQFSNNEDYIALTIAADVTDLNLVCNKIYVAPTYAIGGEVTLPASAAFNGMTLTINGSDVAVNLTNNVYSLGEYRAGSYSIGISEQPNGLLCRFGDAADSQAYTTVTLTNAAVSDLHIVCQSTQVQTHALSGTVTLPLGESFTGLTINVNGTPISFNSLGANGGYQLGAYAAGTYALEITDVPTGLACTFTDNQQAYRLITVSQAVDNLAIACQAEDTVSQYAINGQVDTPTAVDLTLTINGEAKTVTVSPTKGDYTLGNTFVNGQYSVNISGVPAGNSCTFVGGALFQTVTVNQNDAAVPTITCQNASETYAVKATITGLNADLIVRFNNQAKIISAAPNGSDIPLSLGELENNTDYQLSIYQQPTGQACRLSDNASGRINNAEVTITVACTSDGLIFSDSFE